MATIRVPITKGKGWVEVNTDDPSDGGDLPAGVFAEALLQGLKVIFNRGMTKITKEAYPVEAEMKAAAMDKAAKTLEDVRAGKIRIMGAKADKVSGAVMTEARRLARNLVKDEMKRQGIKVSYVEASEITKAANALLAAQPDLVEQAKAALAEREKKGEKIKAAIDVASIPISSKKKAAADKKKAEAKEQLSAAKAGKTKKSKPAAQPNA